MQLIQAAKSNKEIAYDLCLTVGTVKEYLFHIFRKLQVKNRTELAMWAIKRSAGGRADADASSSTSYNRRFEVIQSAS